uniref:VWFA domain-containing protein n=1 Tax=Panagrolaimus davidi TaxID=227884 RepID=A0A914PST0_9BILA
MFLLLFLFWIFQLSFAFQVPICKTVRHTGIFSDAYLSTLYTFSFDLTVNANAQNPSYPNTVTVTNFTEWYLNSTVFNRISPWSFVLYDKINKSIECPSMTENCVIQFPNGQQRYYFDFSYKNRTDSTKFVLGTKVFVNEGTFFDGISGYFWNPHNLTDMAINMSFSGTDLSLTGYSICTNFDYINIPDSGNDMCNTFEMNTTISIPFVSNPIYTYAKVVVTNMTYKVENFSAQNLPDQSSMYVDYILDPSIPINTQELRFPDNVHYDFLFDYNSSQHQLNGIFLGELIKRNGMFLKNENQPFTPESMSGEIASLMNSFTIAPDGNHTTRVGLIAYATNVTVYLQLNKTTNYDDFVNLLFNLADNVNPDDSGGKVQPALLQASNIIPSANDRSRVPIIVLFAAAYDPDGLDGAVTISNRIKADGISIVAVNYDFENGYMASMLKLIASPGYYYPANADILFGKISYAFTQINCVCPTGYTQFFVNNTNWGNITKYADCFFSDGALALPNLAERVCSSRNSGSLIALTSQKRFDFFTDQFLPLDHAISKKKQLTIGLHKSSTDGQWKWWGYNGTEYPYANYPPMATPAPNDNYGYMWNWYGFNWTLQTGKDFSYSYICQQQGCDVNNFCDIALKAHVKI